MKKVAVALLAVSLWAADVGQYYLGQSITVNNSTAVAINVGLQNATTVQLYISPASTAQTFTLTLPNGSSIPVPSGGQLTLPFNTRMNAGDRIGTVVTGTGSATLVVISGRDR